MRKIYTLIATLTFVFSAFAQVPEKMSYQVIVRDAGNTLTANQTIGMQISILQTTVSGTAVYVETQTPTTNENGLVSIEIGTGNVVTGSFSSIDWASDTYFIKTETDPTGGTDYTIVGTTQLMSVPYALHAKTAESVTNDAVNDADSDPTNEIELPAGGTEGQVLKTDGNGNYAWVDQVTDTQNERIYFSARNQNNNSQFPSWTNNKHNNKIDVVSDFTRRIKVEEAGLYYVACSANIFNTNLIILDLYVNESLVFDQRGSFAGYVATDNTPNGGGISRNWSLYLNADDEIEVVARNGSWDGAGAGEVITIFKID